MKTISFAVKKTGDINTDTRALIERFVPIMLRFLRESYGLSADGAPRHLVALPDWSPALRSSAREKPLGARVAALPQLQLFEEAS